MKHTTMKQLLCFLFMLTTQWATAQTTFSARVVDAETGEGLPLVGVYVSAENYTLTNYDGDFSLTAAPEDMVRLTCIGRQTLTLRASSLPAKIPMKLLDATLSEVAVQAVEGTLLQVAKKTAKAFSRHQKKEAQYFYRQTSVFSLKQDIVEAFVGAKSAVNLRQLQFLTGRHGLLTQAAWNRSTISDMNLHHLLEIGPMTRDAQFWHSLITPLSSSAAIYGIDYLQRYYNITIDEIDGDDQHLYRFNLQRREQTEELKAPIMTGSLYVDRASLNPLAFDGQVENLKLSFSKGGLRSPTVVPMTFDFHIDYRYEHKFAEVADLLVQARWGDFSTRALLFNVEAQKRLRIKKNRGKVRENMLASIAEAGYDSTFWANNEVVKRTAEEQAIAQGSVDLTQARLDSVAAYQASLPPLERLSDRLERFGQAIPQEKVFIHMDNTSYFLGDTIWFAAYLRKTNTDTPSRMSRVLYAELWNHDGYLVERKLIEMQDGRGRGFFALPDTLYSGYFELRAYTRWQLNWGQTEHYHVWSTEYWFYNKAMAKDFFRDYEKLYSRVFPVYDKPKQAGDFYKDMTFRPLRRYFKDAPKEPELRLSLFPEGGNLVAGEPCRIAFEAATSEGEVREGKLSLQRKGKRLKIKNERGEEVDFVRTENRGRGSFVFTPVEGENYEAVFTLDQDPTLQGAETSKKGKNQSVSQDIEAVKAEGVSLQVHRDSLSGDWSLDIAAAGQAAQQPLGLTVMHEGKLLIFKEIPTNKQQGIVHCPLSIVHCPLSIVHSDLPTGVNQITVFDSIGHIYADRLFFVTHPELTQPTLQLTGNKEQYEPFERIDLDIASTRLMPDQHVSLAVRDAVHADNTFDSGNILTEMLLSSEIKGFVPQPDYFFEADDEEHRRALDLLMMTQGWRRFNWQSMAIKGAWDITHPAEHTQMVTGTVNRYWINNYEGDDLYNLVLADHERFMTEVTPSLSEEQQTPLVDDEGRPTVFGIGEGSWGSSIRQRNMGWNLNQLFEQPSGLGAINSTGSSIFSAQGSSWDNTDYNQLSFKTTKTYRDHIKRQQEQAARHYIETGSIKNEVRVHAEFADPNNQDDFLVGETETKRGQFQIDLPRFNGQCLFFLGASDTTKWHKKWDGPRKRKPHVWVQMDNYDEYDLIAGDIPDYPEFYVRLNYPYPRWIKPYTYYQVHNAQQRDTSYLSPRLLTDGTHLMDQVTIRARHGGLRRIDFSKPAYVIDAYEALNLAMDAGLLTPSNCSYAAASQIAKALISDMAMHREWGFKYYLDNMGDGYWWGPLEERRYTLLTNIDKIYIYTDYSPRREGDERFDQANQPVVAVDLRRFPDKTQRVVYRDRRYVLNGFSYQEDFYHPDYQRNPPTEGQKDYRRTLYWNPDLQLDASGRAHVTLYNNSQKTQICVEANGQTADGGLLHSGMVTK